jgi:hypothetical protein
MGAWIDNDMGFHAGAALFQRSCAHLAQRDRLGSRFNNGHRRWGGFGCVPGPYRGFLGGSQIRAVAARRATSVSADASSPAGWIWGRVLRNRDSHRPCASWLLTPYWTRCFLSVAGVAAGAAPAPSLQNHAAGTTPLLRLCGALALPGRSGGGSAVSAGRGWSCWRGFCGSRFKTRRRRGLTTGLSSGSHPRRGVPRGPGTAPSAAAPSPPGTPPVRNGRSRARGRTA